MFFFLSGVCYVACGSVYLCLVFTCLERADLILVFLVSNCEFVTFPIGILCQVWYLIVSIPDLCTLTYFKYILLVPNLRRC